MSTQGESHRARAQLNLCMHAKLIFFSHLMAPTSLASLHALYLQHFLKSLQALFRVVGIYQIH